jgi:hypothetical protein
MLDTSMNAILFAKKLRQRQSELKTKYKKDLDKYARDFESWKAALARFLVNDAKKNVEKLLRSKFDENRYSEDYWKSTVLADCPKPPKRPTDEVIRKIAAALRHIAITGQKTVHLNSSDLETYFGDEADGDK